MNVSAVLVTRGNVQLDEIINSIADAGIEDIVVWDNSKREDLAVYGRYAAIAEASHDVIFVQDDDVLHDPTGIQEIIRAHDPAGKLVTHDGPNSYVTCNMPRAFRSRAFYNEHSLVGFGAVFHRDLPAKAFDRFEEHYYFIDESLTGERLVREPARLPPGQPGTLRITEPKVYAHDYSQHEHAVVLQKFWKTCDIVFTGLSPRVLVDVDYRDMPWASSPGRMWTQPWHQEIRDEMLDLVLKVRDS